MQLSSFSSKTESNTNAKSDSFSRNFDWIFDLIPCWILLVILSSSGILSRITRPHRRWLLDFFMNSVRSSIKVGHKSRYNEDAISAALDANLSIMKLFVCFPESSSPNKKFLSWSLKAGSNWCKSFSIFWYNNCAPRKVNSGSSLVWIMFLF